MAACKSETTLVCSFIIVQHTHFLIAIGFDPSPSRSGPFVGPWAVRAQLLDPGPFGPNCLDPGPFGPIVWTLGRSGPIWLGMSILQGQWACPMPDWACPMSRLGPSHARLGPSHAQVGPVPCQVGHVPCQVGHVPCPGCLFGSHLGTHFCLGPILDPIWGPICPGTYCVPLGPGWGERAAPGGRRPTFRGSGGEAPGNFTDPLPWFAWAQNLGLTFEPACMDSV